MRKRKNAARQCIELACLLRNGHNGSEEAVAAMMFDVVNRLETIAETLGLYGMLGDAICEER